jgi:hypothetical protein
MLAARIVRTKSPAGISAWDADRHARAAAAGSRRIAWEITRQPDGADRYRLARAEGQRAFTATTGLDPHGEPCRALCMCLMLAFATDAEARRARRASAERRPRGRPSQDPALRRLLASAVDTLGGAAPAALFLLIHGLDAWTVFPASAHRLDVRRVYTGLVKDLSRIAKVTPRTSTVELAPGDPLEPVRWPGSPGDAACTPAATSAQSGRRTV